MSFLVNDESLSLSIFVNFSPDNAGYKSAIVMPLLSLKSSAFNLRNEMKTLGSIYARDLALILNSSIGIRRNGVNVSECISKFLLYGSCKPSFLSFLNFSSSQPLRPHLEC